MSTDNNDSESLDIEKVNDAADDVEVDDLTNKIDAIDSELADTKSNNDSSDATSDQLQDAVSHDGDLVEDDVPRAGVLRDQGTDSETDEEDWVTDDEGTSEPNSVYSDARDDPQNSSADCSASFLDEHDDGESNVHSESKMPKKDDIPTENSLKDPSFVPRKGNFFMHDDRDAEEEKAVRNNFTLRADLVDRWQHDRFDKYFQAPRSKEEMVQKYGFDIRSDGNKNNKTSEKPEQINSKKSFPKRSFGKRGADENYQQYADEDYSFRTNRSYDTGRGYLRNYSVRSRPRGYRGSRVPSSTSRQSPQLQQPQSDDTVVGNPRDSRGNRLRNNSNGGRFRQRAGIQRGGSSNRRGSYSQRNDEVIQSTLPKPLMNLIPKEQHFSGDDLAENVLQPSVPDTSVTRTNDRDDVSKEKPVVMSSSSQSKGGFSKTMVFERSRGSARSRGQAGRRRGPPMQPKHQQQLPDWALDESPENARRQMPLEQMQADPREATMPPHHVGGMSPYPQHQQTAYYYHPSVPPPPPYYHHQTVPMYPFQHRHPPPTLHHR